MRILMLTPDAPFPPQKGTAMRNYHLLLEASKQHEVHLLTLVDGDLAPVARAELERHCASVTAVRTEPRRLSNRLVTLLVAGKPDLAARRWSLQFAATMQDLLAANDFDLIQIEGLEMAPYLEAIPTGCRARTLYDAHNAEYRLQQRAMRADFWPPTRWPKALYSLIQWRRLLAFERMTLGRVDAVTAVSPVDRAALSLLEPKTEIAVVHNGIDCDYYREVQPRAERPTLVFTGTMDFRPNVDAMVWFCREIFPLILDEIPDCHLLIVGRDPAAAVLRLVNERVHVSGTTEDVRPFLGQSQVYVVPLRIGGGTRFKVLEALAAGLPVVTTTVGAEGIGGVHGRDLLFADTPSEFAAAVVRLIRDSNLAHALVEAGRTFVRREFDWPIAAAEIHNVYRQLPRDTMRPAGPPRPAIPGASA